MLRECTGSILPSACVACSGSQEEGPSLTLTGGHTNGEGEVEAPLNKLERTESTSCVCGCIQRKWAIALLMLLLYSLSASGRYK